MSALGDRKMYVTGNNDVLINILIFVPALNSN